MLDKADEASRTRILTDGTAVDELIDRERREINLRVYSDPEIYQIELERIWSKAWIVAGHESEIPNPGDFVTRKIGDDPVILVRTRDGSIECLLNVCPHRGTTVCRTDAGNENVFRCIYHGWVFNLDGSFRGAPFVDQVYSAEEKDVSRMGLRRARVGVHAGIVFVNWQENGASLDDYLGDFKWYLDLLFSRTNRGFEVMGAPQRFVIDANWKTVSEQFASDGWHASQLHRSLSDLNGADPNDPSQWMLCAPKVSTPEGHSIICFDMGMVGRQNIPNFEDMPPEERLALMLPPGVPPNLHGDLKDNFTQEELKLLSETPPSNGGMFPNVGLWNTAGMLADGTPAPFVSVRTHVPLGPDKFEFLMWTLVARDAPEEYREIVRKTTSFSQGATGFVEQDDAAVWPGMTASSRGFVARQTTPGVYWAIAGANKPDDWPGGGQVHTGFQKDDTQWAWWQRYFDYMTNAI